VALDSIDKKLEKIKKLVSIINANQADKVLEK